ncbi:MAG: hypothetical protein Kow0092_39420 [Deferrisomatales bacterium]
MKTQIARNFVAFCLWLLAAATVAAMGFWAALENYLGCRSALELLGYEKAPLGTDPLLGEVLGVFFPNATLPNAMALTTAAVVAVGLFVFFHELFKIFHLAHYAHEARQREELAQVREALWRLFLSAAVVAISAALLYRVMGWNVFLFRFRCICGVLGIEDPVVAASTVESWGKVLSTYGHLYSVRMADRGAWDYLAMTAIACLMLEVTLVKVADRFARFTASAHAWWLAARSAEAVPYLTQDAGAPAAAYGEPGAGVDPYGAPAQPFPQAAYPQYAEAASYPQGEPEPEGGSWGGPEGAEEGGNGRWRDGGNGVDGPDGYAGSTVHAAPAVEPDSWEAAPWEGEDAAERSKAVQ